MNKLDKIKAEVSEVDGYKAEFAKYGNNADTMGGRNAHEDILTARLNGNAYEYLKALLPIVEAAIEFDKHYEDMLIEDSTNEGFEAVSKLRTVVHALLQTSPEPTGDAK